MVDPIGFSLQSSYCPLEMIGNKYLRYMLGEKMPRKRKKFKFYLMKIIKLHISG